MRRPSCASAAAGTQATLIGAWRRTPRETEGCLDSAETVALVRADDDQVGPRFHRQLTRRASRRSATGSTTRTSSSPSMRVRFAQFPFQKPLHFRRIPEDGERPAETQPRCSACGQSTCATTMSHGPETAQMRRPSERGFGDGREIRRHKTFSERSPRAQASNGAAERTTSVGAATDSARLFRYTAQSPSVERRLADGRNHDERRRMLFHEFQDRALREAPGQQLDLDGSAGLSQPLGLGPRVASVQAVETPPASPCHHPAR